MKVCLIAELLCAEDSAVLNVLRQVVPTPPEVYKLSRWSVFIRGAMGNLGIRSPAVKQSLNIQLSV
jgi:hypothetical protein